MLHRQVITVYFQRIQNPHIMTHAISCFTICSHDIWQLSCVGAHAYTCTYTCIYIYIHVYTCTCTCIYIHVYTCRSGLHFENLTKLETLRFWGQRNAYMLRILKPLEIIYFSKGAGANAPTYMYMYIHIECIVHTVHAHDSKNVHVSILIQLYMWNSTVPCVAEADTEGTRSSSSHYH